MRDRALQKRTIGDLVLDTRREICANKVAALVGRSETRDRVDLQWLLESGEPLERAVTDAGLKDAGVDPATVAWTLEQLKLAGTAHLPGDADPVALERFRVELVARLRALALSTTAR